MSARVCVQAEQGRRQDCKTICNEPGHHQQRNKQQRHAGQGQGARGRGPRAVWWRRGAPGGSVHVRSERESTGESGRGHRGRKPKSAQARSLCRAGGVAACTRPRAPGPAAVAGADLSCRLSQELARGSPRGRAHGFIAQLPFPRTITRLPDERVQPRGRTTIEACEKERIFCFSSKCRGTMCLSSSCSQRRSRRLPAPPEEAQRSSTPIRSGPRAGSPARAPPRDAELNLTTLQHV